MLYFFRKKDLVCVCFILHQVYKSIFILDFQRFQQYLSSIYTAVKAFEIQRAVSVVSTQTLICATVQKASIHGWMHFYMWLWCPIFFCFNNIFQCHKACHAKRVYYCIQAVIHIFTQYLDSLLFKFCKEA